ncbi:hypothetical protein H0X06_01790 [Candidatus Dependentiae bacterium]|nr:hypothetical protein [Candidatus Dependentiae bacterium]
MFLFSRRTLLLSVLTLGPVCFLYPMQEEKCVETIEKLPAEKEFTFLKTLCTLKDPIKVGACSPDGKTLLIGLHDRIALFDCITGECIKIFEIFQKDFSVLAFSHDGNTIFIGVPDYIIQDKKKTVRSVIFFFYDAQTGQQKDKNLRMDESRFPLTPFPLAALSADKNSSFINVSGQQAFLWDYTSGKSRPLTTLVYNTYMTSAVFSWDGQLLLGGYNNGESALWEGATGKERGRYKSPINNNDSVTAVAFSSDNKIALIGYSNGDITLWETGTGSFLQMLHGNTDQVSVLGINKDNNTIFSGSIDQTVRVWKNSQPSTDDAEETYTPFKTLPHEIKLIIMHMFLDLYNVPTIKRNFGFPRIISKSKKYEFSTLALSPTGKSIFLDLALRPLQGNIVLEYTGLLINSRTGEPIRNAKTHEPNYFEGPTGYINSAVFSSDGTTLFTGSSDNTACLEDVTDKNTDENHLQIFQGYTNEITAVSYSHDKNTLFTTSRDKKISLWNAESGALLYTFENDDPLTSIARNVENKSILIEPNSKNACIWNIHLKEIKNIKIGPNRLVVLSPDGHTLFTVSKAYRNPSQKPFAIHAYFWDSRTGKGLKPRLKGHTSAIVSAVFSPDNRTILTGLLDGSAILWDVKNGKILQHLANPLKKAHQAKSVLFSPNGNTIYINCVEGIGQDSVEVLLSWSSVPSEELLLKLPILFCGEKRKT